MQIAVRLPIAFVLYNKPFMKVTDCFMQSAHSEMSSNPPFIQFDVVTPPQFPEFQGYSVVEVSGRKAEERQVMGYPPSWAGTPFACVLETFEYMRNTGFPDLFFREHAVIGLMPVGADTVVRTLSTKNNQVMLYTNARTNGRKNGGRFAQICFPQRYRDSTSYPWYWERTFQQGDSAIIFLSVSPFLKHPLESDMVEAAARSDFSILRRLIEPERIGALKREEHFAFLALAVEF